SVRKPDSDATHDDLYALAFLSNDDKGMAEQLAWLKDHKEYAHLGWSKESDTDAYKGHVRKARDLTRQAVAAAEHVNREAAPVWGNSAALREAPLDNSELALKDADEALKLPPQGQEPEMEPPLAFALAVYPAKAHPLIGALNRRFALDTQVQSLLLPTVKAQ